LSQEVAPLGINVTIMEPGVFRTDWAGRSMAESAIEIADYADTSEERRRLLPAITSL